MYVFFRQYSRLQQTRVLLLRLLLLLSSTVLYEMSLFDALPRVVSRGIIVARTTHRAKVKSLFARVLGTLHESCI